MSISLNNSLLQIDSSILNHGLSFDEYLNFHQSIVEDKLLFHANYKEQLFNLTKDNLAIVHSVLKSIELDKKLYNFIDSVENQKWILFIEPWCIDSVHILPIIFSIAQCNDKIQFIVQLRDKNHDFLKQNLGEGYLSIPKLLILNSDNKLMSIWGAMPQKLRELTNNMKTKDYSPKDISDYRHEWYIQDGTYTTQIEIYELLKSIKSNENL